MHPGSQEKASCSGVQGNAPSHKVAPPRLRLGGKSQPAIELLTVVSKAGSWRQIVVSIRIRPPLSQRKRKDLIADSYNPISRANF